MSRVCERGVADVDSGQWQCNWIFSADACYTGISAGSTGEGEGSWGILSMWLTSPMIDADLVLWGCRDEV